MFVCENFANARQSCKRNSLFFIELAPYLSTNYIYIICSYPALSAPVHLTHFFISYKLTSLIIRQIWQTILSYSNSFWFWKKSFSRNQSFVSKKASTAIVQRRYCLALFSQRFSAIKVQSNMLSECVTCTTSMTWKKRGEEEEGQKHKVRPTIFIWKIYYMKISYSSLYRTGSN